MSAACPLLVSVCVLAKQPLGALLLASPQLSYVVGYMHGIGVGCCRHEDRWVMRWSATP